MRKIRLLFSTSSHPLSAVIRAVTWSRWSHVAIVDGETVIEATATHGVCRTRTWEAIARSTHYAFVDLPCDDPAAVIAAAAGEIGKPYDFSGVAGLGLHRDWQQNDAWFCSELVAWSFAQAGFPLLRADVMRRVSPQHLWMLPPVFTADASVSLCVPFIN